MTRYDLAYAIGTIHDGDILDAKQHGAQKNRGPWHRPILRRAAVFAAIFAVLCCIFVTAFAASEDFRTRVYTLFHIPTVDTAQPFEEEVSSSEIEEIELVHSSDFAGAVTLDYIRFDESSGYSSINNWDDETNTFQTVVNGQFEEIPTNTASLTFTWENTEYDISFCWCMLDGIFHWNKSSESSGWYISSIDGQNNTVVLVLDSGQQAEYTERAFLLDLDTLTVSDPFDGCELNGLPNIIDISFSSNLNGAILTGEGDAYYCGFTAHSVTAVSALFGDSISGAWYLDGDTLGILSIDEENLCTCAQYDLETGESTLLLSGLPFRDPATHTGLQFTGTKYALYVDTENAIWVYDLLLNTCGKIEGLGDTGDSVSALVNFDCSKLLLSVMPEDEFQISQLGVLDLEQGILTILDREGYTNETSLSWFNNDTVAIYAENEQGEDYLYLYTFTGELRAARRSLTGGSITQRAPGQLRHGAVLGAFPPCPR